MRPEDLVFWLDVLREDRDLTVGVLCQRHADTMVVPRNWTLDDLRDPDLHLFRPPPVSSEARPRSRRSTSGDVTAEQLRLAAFTDAAEPEELPPPEVAAAATVEPGPWAPDFDAGDDLDGLLAARSLPVLYSTLSIWWTENGG